MRVPDAGIASGADTAWASYTLPKACTSEVAAWNFFPLARR